jgi:uroporphyrinogen-III synthase
LAGRGVLITRPQEQAAGLAQAVTEAGGIPILFPTLAIIDPPDAQPLDEALARLDEFDLVIFVSPIAASRGMAAIRSRRTLPPSLRVAAVGAGSARTLARLGVNEVIVPEQGADSEALLATAPLTAVRGKQIVIFRGVGGRELLADTLRTRGAAVTCVACYQRTRPQAETSALLAAWRDGRIQAVTAMSAEALENLRVLLGAAGEQLLRETPLFVPHRRIEAAAQALGCRRIIVAAASDQAMAASLSAYFAAEIGDAHNFQP